MSYLAPGSRRTKSRYFVSLQRGDRLRCMAMRPATFFAAMTLLPACVLGFAGTSAYLAFHDDILGAVVSEHRSAERAYQMRISSLQTQLDRVSTRQLIDQETLENRMGDLATRQSKLETRAAMLASLTDMVGLQPATTAAAPARSQPAAARPSLNPLLSAPAPAPALPEGVLSYSDAGRPVSAYGRPVPMPADGKPQPESIEPPAAAMPAPVPAASRNKLRSSALTPTLSLVADRALPMNSRLRSLTASLESLELKQVTAIDQLGAAAQARGQAIESAIASAGLNANELKVPGVKNAGGPFVPLVDKTDDSAFGRGVRRVQTTIEKSEKLFRLLPHIPLRQPLPGTLDVTSPYGGRMDPFYGRAAMHTGVDLRDDMGSAVRVTAAGRVVTAGWNGGYGNMVEVDHGNGLTTRYGHLSAIDAKEGQMVNVGDIVGRLGSTGRSTGPHLHYEVRVDGDPVDPTRFLRAGGRIDASTLAYAVDITRTARQ